MDSPNYKHGKYSKYLPATLRDRCEEALSDPELGSLRGDLAVWQLRVWELQERLYGGESGSLWRLLRETWARLEAAHARLRADPTDAAASASQAAALAQVSRLIKTGSAAEDEWTELADAQKHKAKVAQAEWERQADLGTLITAEQALGVVNMLWEIFVKHVHDPAGRREFSQRVQLLIAQRKQVLAEPVVIANSETKNS